MKKTTHELRLRSQLLRYIDSFLPPQHVVEDANDAVIPNWNLNKDYPWQWNKEWLNKQTQSFLVLFIEGLEDYYGVS